MSDIKHTLKLIREGYTYEEVMQESAILAGTILVGYLFGVIGLVYLSNKKNASEDKGQSNAEKNKEREEFLSKNSAPKIVEQMKKDVKKMVTALKGNSAMISKINEKIKNNKNLESTKYRLTYDDNGDYIVIIDAEQDVASALHWVISDMVDAIKAKYHDAIRLNVVKVSSGDGDEGCIYIE